MLTVTYTTQEAEALTALIDIACKSGGLRVAEACVVLLKKLTEASKPISVAAAD